MNSNPNYGNLTFGKDTHKRDRNYVIRVTALNALRKLTPNGINVFVFPSDEFEGDLYELQTKATFPGLLPDGLFSYPLFVALDNDISALKQINGGDLSNVVFWCFSDGGTIYRDNIFPAGLPKAAVTAFNTFCFSPTKAPFVFKDLKNSKSYLKVSDYVGYINGVVNGKTITDHGDGTRTWTERISFIYST